MIQYRFDDPVKRCFRCGENKQLVAFYRHPAMLDGHLNKCMECTKSDVAARAQAKAQQVRDYDKARSQGPHRKAWALQQQRKMRARYPEKDRARQILHYHLRSGKLTRKPCEVCGTAKAEAHHKDYSKPLDVEWLCFRHHREAHGRHLREEAVHEHA